MKTTLKKLNKQTLLGSEFNNHQAGNYKKDMKTTATTLIKKERFEQTNKHGYTAQHDDEVNSHYQLQIAAAAIIDADDSQFPAGWDLVLVQKMCDKTKLERLVIAAAFYTAEQERIERIICGLRRDITKILDAEEDFIHQ